MFCAACETRKEETGGKNQDNDNKKSQKFVEQDTVSGYF